MDKTPGLLFEYLRDIIYNPGHAKVDMELINDSYKDLAAGLAFFSKSLNEMRRFANSLANGDLSDMPPSKDNELAAPLKALQANLRHITWQTQQVAKGDYNQNIDFMGEFSEAFNSMIKQLDARQKALQDEIEVSRQKTRALSQSNRLLANITSSIPQMIVVLEKSTGKLLFQNLAAELEFMKSHDVMETLLYNMKEGRAQDDIEIITRHDQTRRFLSISRYTLQWDGLNAYAFLIDDISANKAQMEKLETQAYHDSLTGLHNRLYGMQMLNIWLEQKKDFALCFVDLNNLKYVNDTFGHHEGDQYLIRAAALLNTFSADTVTCRLGGDEFMLLCPGYTDDTATARIEQLCDELHQDALKRDYIASMSYGIVDVTVENTLSASALLGIADERMYENKRQYKMANKMML